MDEILVGIVPLLLGDGVRLFEVAGGANICLERIDLSHAESVTNLWLRVLG